MRYFSSVQDAVLWLTIAHLAGKRAALAEEIRKFADTVQERVTLFDKLKSAYDFRSKAVHGSYVSAKKLKTEISPAVADCDEIVHKVVKRVTEIKSLQDYVFGLEKGSENFEKAMTEICFGGPQVAEA
jgi:hypothetical protein